MKKGSPSGKKPFEKHIVKLQQEGMGVGQAFHNFLDIAVDGLMLQDKPDKYTETYAKMLADLINIMEDSAQNSSKDQNHKIADDYLGEFYMEFVSNGEQGQYFTPQNISDLMAMMIMEESQDGMIETVADPSGCGSGRNLLAAAKVKGKRSIYAMGVDLDARCCKMAVINLFMNGIDGEIYHKNGLTDDYYGGRSISMRPYPNIKFIPELPEHMKLKIKRAVEEQKEKQLSQLTLF